MKIEAIGGPYDGNGYRYGRALIFLWLDERQARRTSGEGRALYRLEARGECDAPAKYLYAGRTYAACKKCGAYHERGERDQCTLCGGKLLL